MSRFSRQRPDEPGASPLGVWFFDCLHLDGRRPDRRAAGRADRRPRPGGRRPWRVPAVVTADPAAADLFLAGALAAGHEGVVVKAVESRYEAGRRGQAWRKVKPVHTFDLVVLAAEWGHGRRRGWLSNLHLGARDPAGGVGDGRQDVQGPDRRPAGLADRSPARPPEQRRRHRRVRPARAGRRDRHRRRAEVHPLPRRGGPALRPGPALPRRQGPRGGRHHRRPARPAERP